MKQDEAGFTLIELLIAGSIVALITGAAAMATFQVTKNTERTNDHLTAVHHADKAGYWINRDARMAESITAEGLTSPEFLILRWTDWGYDEDSIYHTTTYSIEDVVGGIGKLKRAHQDSGGGNDGQLVAEHIYYNPDDPENTTQVSWESQKLTLKVVTILGESQESRGYQTYSRPNFYNR